MRLEILERQFDRNKGHSMRVHGGKAMSETGLMYRCYRCRLLILIDKEKRKVSNENFNDRQR